MVGYESSSIQHKSVGPLVQALFHMKPIHKAVARFYKIYSKLPRDPTDGSIVAKYKTRAKFMNELSWQFNRMEKQKMPVNLVHLCEILGSSINTALCMDIGRHLGVLIEIFSTFLPRLSAAFTGDQVVVTTEDVGFRKPGVLSRKKGPARKAKQVKFTYIDLDAEEHRNVDQALCKYTSERSSYMVNSDLFPTQPYVKAITKVHFFQLPLIMVLNVQRFPDRGYPDIGGWKTKTFEFKETIDMEQYLGCYIGDRSAKTLYSLYAIFLCRGRCPHQVYSCILQIGRDNWLYFEDELVFPMSRSQVFDEYNVEQLQSFEPEAQRQRDIWAAKRFSSVCMLMYVRNDLFEKSFS
ncbi:hypothetical protein FBU59_002476 [Linderina macrospora]|uniref:Uncharacterized protein n=1 Tax=Linderina macrospora TaxID=4868 RepID=A0ACC1JB12_9FUNG|nr:hypothetical protein FBU59_002476 [Linderina macrospora]